MSSIRPGFTRFQADAGEFAFGPAIYLPAGIRIEVEREGRPFGHLWTFQRRKRLSGRFHFWQAKRLTGEQRIFL